MKLIHAMNETGTLEEFLRINPLYKGAPIKPNVLVSYNYLRGIALKLTKTLRDGIGSLNLDSGGYSIYTGKSLHTLHDYLSFVKLYSHLFDVVFSLDSDFNNPEGNLTNQLWLEEKLGDNSKKIVPVVHDKIAPFEELEMYAENGYNQVAVGSDGKLSDEFFEKVKAKYPDLKLHVFGRFDRKIFQVYKPFSADTASFQHQARFDLIYYWEPTEEKEYTVRIGKREKQVETGGAVHFRDFKHTDKLKEFLKNTFNYTYNDLATSEVRMRVVNLYFFTQLEDYYNSH